MYSFLISVAALILGYFLYGRFLEKVFKPDPNIQTPAYTKSDGIDYLPMPTWKVFMIQLLNIAGTGPIFGAIMGAKFGPACYLWIVLGCIFAGATHDYLSGMLSLRHGGAGLPDMIGAFLGKRTKNVMLTFTVLMLVLVVAVFVYSPAVILGDLTGGGSEKSVLIWVFIVFVYYVVATFLPIDKIIGKIYPLFAIALIFMALSLMVCLIIKWPTLPEAWQGLGNKGPSIGVNGQAIFPCLFITIACGAISGFHATQSPLMARCMKNEKLGRPVFYGSMITEGIIALIWATISSWFFFDGGAAEVGGSLTTAAPTVVSLVSKSWLGAFGGVLAILGVVAAPITSGDTAMRSARLIIADALKLNQHGWSNRLIVTIPLIIVSGLLTWFNIHNSEGFNTVWRYFGWANQTLSIFTLWAITVWLAERRPGMYYLITLIPACFMTAVCFSYICVAPIGFNLPDNWALSLAIVVFIIAADLFFFWKAKAVDRQPRVNDHAYEQKKRKETNVFDYQFGARRSKRK